MCIIAYDSRVETQERIPKAVLERCMEKYPHGMGIMYAKDERLHTWRTLDDFNGLWDRYTTARDLRCNVALHFRYTTEGDTVLDNCHPFHINSNFAFMHNGTVNALKRHLPDGISDSRYLASDFFKDLPVNFLSKPAFIEAIYNLVSGDRLFFMDCYGRTKTINAGRGFWNDGVWYSHARDRRYLLTGEKWTATIGKNKSSKSSPSASKSYSKESKASDEKVDERPYSTVSKDRKESYRKDRHAAHREASSRWYARAALRNRILVFDYGLFGPAEMTRMGLTPYEDDIVTLPDVQLWALEEEPSFYRAAGIRKDDHITHGELYVAEHGASLPDLITQMDAWTGRDEKKDTHENTYRLVKRDIKVGDKLMVAWVYMANEFAESTNLIAPVPHGEWAIWQDWEDRLAESNSDPTAAVAEAQLSVVQEACPSCKTYNTTGYDLANPAGGYDPHLWCHICNEEFPVSTPRKEIH